METPKPTEELKRCVNSYLIARANAETHKEKVDSIKRMLLESAIYNADPEKAHRREMPERITNPENDWLLADDEFHDYLIDLKHELIKSGYDIKPIEGEPEYSYYCPALQAESIQRKTEHLVIDSCAAMLGEKNDFRHRLLCAGIEKYQQFIDLAVKFVVNSPGYQAPKLAS